MNSPPACEGGFTLTASRTSTQIVSGINIALTSLLILKNKTHEMLPDLLSGSSISCFYFRFPASTVWKGKAGKFREPWLTRDIEGLVRTKKEAYVRSRQLGSSESLEEYRGCRTTLKKEIRRAKRGHEISLADNIKKNPKRFYKYIKSKRVARERVGPLTDQCGNLRVEPQEMGEVLNEYFASVFTFEKVMEASEFKGGNSDILEHINITKEDVLEALKHIKVDKSPGPDQVYPRMLWEAKVETAGVLAEIFVSSLAMGEVPEDWRIANVVPLLKKDRGISQRTTGLGALHQWWESYWKGF
ncbi:uncharacterized protein [Heterodontus francisci]|uniref:uncharacterized protein n=1 Tax=Heterodontus francisci TaxID=7792 RepID=UPI00355B76BD